MTPRELGAELTLQLERTKVDLRAAQPRMYQVLPPVKREKGDGTVEGQFDIDGMGVIKTLQQLPDGAGTDAFVAAYNARPGFRSASS